MKKHIFAFKNVSRLNELGMQKKNHKNTFQLGIYILLIVFVSFNFFNCKSRVQVAVEEQQAKKKNIDKEAEKQYAEAVKQHKAKQSKATRKMMKKSEKQRKKVLNKTIRKNKCKSGCVSY